MAMMAIGGVLGIGAGCRDNSSPPPPRVPVPVPASESPIVRRDDGMKPLPPPPNYENQIPAPPFDDPPLVLQQPPEQPAFTDAYKRVGQPRIVVFVNRTLEGKPAVPEAGHTETYHRPSNDPQQQSAQYEFTAGRIDYAAIENIMTDWLACNGQVSIISPTMARQRLTDEQIKELQEHRPAAMSEIVQQLGADVLVQVQAHATRQTPQGLEVRMVGEAMNIKGGQSIGRAVVDIPPPLEKTTINRYTRFLARKLMDDMTGAWTAAPPQAPPAPAAPTAPEPTPSTQP
jgi:hypothetical protein